MSHSGVRPEPAYVLAAHPRRYRFAQSQMQRTRSSKFRCRSFAVRGSRLGGTLVAVGKDRGWDQIAANLRSVRPETTKAQKDAAADTTAKIPCAYANEGPKVGLTRTATLAAAPTKALPYPSTASCSVFDGRSNASARA